MARTVFVMDDEPELVDLMQAILEGEGYTVVTTTNPSNAAEQAAQVRPDLFILDLWMPGKTGLDVLEELRRQPQTAATPAILCTAAPREALAQADRLNAARCLVLPRPFEVDDLLHLVYQALQPAAHAGAPEIWEAPMLGGASG